MNEEQAAYLYFEINPSQDTGLRSPWESYFESFKVHELYPISESGIWPDVFAGVFSDKNGNKYYSSSESRFGLNYLRKDKHDFGVYPLIEARYYIHLLCSVFWKLSCSPKIVFTSDNRDNALAQIEVIKARIKEIQFNLKTNHGYTLDIVDKNNGSTPPTNIGNHPYDIRIFKN